MFIPFSCYPSTLNPAWPPILHSILSSLFPSLAMLAISYSTSPRYVQPNRGVENNTRLIFSRKYAGVMAVTPLLACTAVPRDALFAGYILGMDYLLNILQQRSVQTRIKKNINSDEQEKQMGSKEENGYVKKIKWYAEFASAIVGLVSIPACYYFSYSIWANGLCILPIAISESQNIKAALAITRKVQRSSNKAFLYPTLLYSLYISLDYFLRDLFPNDKYIDNRIMRDIVTFAIGTVWYRWVIGRTRREIMMVRHGDARRY